MKKIFIGILIFIFSISTFFIMKETLAVETVQPGNGTLQLAINNASDGDTLVLKKDQNYKGDITIDKDITISGPDNGYATIDGQITIKNDSKKLNVSLKNYMSSSASIDGSSSLSLENFKKYKYINAETSVNLTLDNVSIFAIARPPAGFNEYNDLGPISLNIGENANDSTININNSKLRAYYDGFHLLSNNNIVNITNSTVEGRLAVNLEGGENNTLTFEGGTVSGRTSMSVNEEVVAINGQKNLKISMNNVEISASDINNKENKYSVFSFDGANQNSKVKIELKGDTTIIDNATGTDSILFNFGKSNLPDSDNSITIANTVKLSPNTVSRKYNKDSSYAVIGIYDKDENCTVKTHMLNTTIPSSMVPALEEKAGYELDGYYYITSSNNDRLKFEPDITNVSENMDIHMNYIKKIKVDIQGSEESFTTESGVTLSEFRKNQKANAALEALKNDKFLGYVDDKGNEVDEDYVFTDDTTISALYKIEVTINDKHFYLNSGDTLSDLIKNEEAKSLLEAYKKVNKKFLYFQTQSEEKIDDDYKFTTDVTITAKYKIVVTIDGEEFELDENQTLEDLDQKDKTRLDSLKDKNMTFKGFYDGDLKVEENKTFSENKTLISKFTVTITVDKNKYTLDYSADNVKKLEDNADLKAKLDELMKVEGKTFSKFLNDSSEEVTLQTNADHDMTITAKYNVTITIKVSTNTKKFTLEEGKTFVDLYNLYKSDIDNLKRSINLNETFKYFEIDGENIKVEDNTKFTINTTIVAKLDIHISSIILPISKEINVGDTLTLDPQVIPENTTDKINFFWLSSNTSVAQITKKGLITAISPGKTLITVQAGGVVSNATTLIVKSPITKIDLDKKEAYLDKGNTLKLNATITPENTTDDKTLTWDSSNKSVATVSNDGLVKAIGIGETTITVTSSKGIKATAKIYVKNTETKPSVTYQTYVQYERWQDWVRDGALSGTTGKELRLEAIKINLENKDYQGDIEYKAHVQYEGWQDWVRNGALSGTTGKALRLEAVQIRLTGEMNKHYDIYYRVHVQSFGWLGWAKNGESAGSAGYSYRLEAIEIVLVEKGKTPPKSNVSAFKCHKVSYQTHVQYQGWQETKYDKDMSGTTGKALRLEAIKIDLKNKDYEGDIEYKSHVQYQGWQDWVKNGAISGTTGKALRLEAIQIRLTGEMSKHYDICYRVHTENFGWLGWAKNGESAGSAGYSYRLEAIEIVLVEKGSPAPGSTNNKFHQK